MFDSKLNGLTMSKKKIMLVFGTRPEAIKMAPLVQRLKEQPKYFDVLVCVTAQHREMLDQVLDIFNISPDIDLNLMRPEQDLFDLTARILKAMRDVFTEKKPDVILVHGDTTTTFTTSIAAFYANIPIGHIEAGLRTYDLSAPFPEEFNRQVTSRIANWNFAPTSQSRENLISEGIEKSKISVTGNTIIDSLHWVLSRLDEDRNRRLKIENVLDSIIGFDWQKKDFILITGHRRENFGKGFLNICYAIRQLAVNYPHVHFVYPAHMNPNVRRPVNDILSNLNNVHIVEPLEYEPFIYLLKHSYFVLTDSGGIQEEAPSLGKPVLVMRDITERPEAIEAGTVELVGSNQEEIISGVSKLLKDKSLYFRMSRAHNPYGDGNACSRIIETLKNI